MSISTKYGRTYHLDFSPGTTSDDRINRDWYEDMLKFERAIETEKMDGGNTCLNGIGIFARSHAAPTTQPWFNHMKQKFSMIQEDLRINEIEIFGENLYAEHSIIYPNIDEHFYIFAVRHLDMWLSWEEVKWYADFFDYPLVPEFGTFNTADFTKEEITNNVIDICRKPSVFGSIQNGEVLHSCTKEGLVIRNIEEYPVDQFKQNVFKYVRKGHVSTDVHWSRNWKRASLVHELKGKNK